MLDFSIGNRRTSSRRTNECAGGAKQSARHKERWYRSRADKCPNDQPQCSRNDWSAAHESPVGLRAVGATIECHAGSNERSTNCTNLQCATTQRYASEKLDRTEHVFDRRGAASDQNRRYRGNRRYLSETRTGTERPSNSKPSNRRTSLATNERQFRAA